jgi:2-hydroxychromene-2-carboxylate isomerase
MAKPPIDFWFEFSSPYSYVAATQIDDLADDHGRAVRWRPIMLGPIFKETGNRPLRGQPLKGDYMHHDVPRFARLFGIDFAWPDPFPVTALAPARAFYWLEQAAPAKAAPFAAACLDAYFADGHDISQPEVCAEVAGRLGIDGAALTAAITTPEVKDRLKAAVAEALAAGVCGAPYIVVDGEAFWGADRLWMVEEWLESGGW